MCYGLSLSTWLHWKMTRFAESALSGCVWGGSQRQPCCARCGQAKGLTRWWISTLNSSWEAGRPWRWSQWRKWLPTVCLWGSFLVQVPHFSCLLPDFHETSKAAFLLDVLLPGFAASQKGKQCSQLATDSNLLLSEPNFLLLSFKWLLLDARQGKKILTNIVRPIKCLWVYLPNGLFY